MGILRRKFWRSFLNSNQYTVIEGCREYSMFGWRNLGLIIENLPVAGPADDPGHLGSKTWNATRVKGKFHEIKYWKIMFL